MGLADRLRALDERALGPAVHKARQSAPRKPSEPEYWFRAKRYGWGWGLPCAWQGWAVLLGALIALGAVQVFFDRAVASVAAIPVLGVLFVVTVRKGEPPRWRWGGR